jgi:carboxypeptidase Taq
MSAESFPDSPACRALLQRIHEIDDLEKAAAVLAWDRDVNMPRAGLTGRVQQMTTLSRLIHDGFTADATGALIEAAAAELDGADYDSNGAALIRVLRRSYADATKLPTEYVERRTRISGEARHAWEKARADDDFASFRPWLAEVVALAQEAARLYGYRDEPYDALLDKYETAASTAEVRALFAALRQALVPLREAIVERGRGIDDRLLRQDYPIAGQQAFARYIAAAAGYDLDRGHIGTVVHPFSISFNQNDVRITTRWYEDFLSPSIFGTLHESGHAIYEQGTHPSLARTPLARGASMGLHESQSRLFENIVGRSLSFWRAHFPRLQQIFPAQLGAHTAAEFHAAVNRVKPSLIRVEADELTYNLHIILRFELEQAMLGGDLVPADLPGAWRDGMRDLLGVAPTNDREGCLQDVHWSSPSFGYFPTYALGNLYSAQIYEAALAQDGAVGRELEAGRTGALLSWLREHLHQHGKKYTPAELAVRVTGRPLSHDAFVRYATAKFTELYGL